MIAAVADRCCPLGYRRSRGGFHFGIEFTGGSRVHGLRRRRRPSTRASPSDAVAVGRARGRAARRDRRRRTPSACRPTQLDRGAGDRDPRPRSPRRTTCRVAATSRSRSSARRGARTSPAGAIRGLVIFLVLVSIVHGACTSAPGRCRSPRIVVAGPRPARHGRRLRHRRLRGHAGRRDRVPDDPRLLALRHRRGVRQGAREHGALATGDPHVRGDGQPRGEPDARALDQHVDRRRCCRSRRSSSSARSLLGAGTLRDISLALFIGIIVGTYSTIFVAAPLYARAAVQGATTIEPQAQARAEPRPRARRPEPTGSPARRPVLASRTGRAE